MPKRNIITFFLSTLFFASTVLLVMFCDDAEKIVTKCDLKAEIIFVNASSDSLDITFIDSTEWNFLPYSSKEISFPESTIHISDSSAYADSISVMWIFEHSDIFEEGIVCSAEVDLEIFAIISRTDSIISIKDLNLCCKPDSLDTLFIDSTGTHIEKFSCSKTIFIP